MNLQNPVQLPANTSATNTTSASTASGQTAAVRPVAGASLGVDFAQIMERQFQNLPSFQKQQLADNSNLANAAETLSKPSESTAEDRTPPPVDVAPVQAQNPGNPASVSATDQQQQPDNADTGATTDAPNSRPSDNKSKAANATPLTLTPIGLVLNLPAVTPIATQFAASGSAPTTTPTTSPATTSPDNLNLVTAAAATTQNSTAVTTQAMLSNPWLKDTALPILTQPATQATSELRTIALSPKMNIVTQANTSTSNESLTAFAKSMGLDESAIAQLLNPNATRVASPATSMVAANLTGTTSPNSLNLTTSMNGASNAGASNAGATLATQTASPSTATQLASLGITSATVDIRSPAPAAASAPTPVSAPAMSNTSGVADPNTLAGAMNAALNVPAQAIPSGLLSAGQSLSAAATSTPVASTNSVSTVDALHLLNTGVSETDVAALASSFAAGDFSGSSAGGQGGDTGGFAQAFAQGNAAPATNTNSTDATTTATSTTSSEQKMEDVYNQLSDKLATEMATRFNKQINDGQWKMKFGLRPANLGGVEVQLEMKDGKLNASFNVDNPLTGHLLQNASTQLRSSLENFGIQAGQVQVGQNASGNQQNSQQGNPQQSNSAQVMENSSRLDNMANESQSDNQGPSTSDSSKGLDLYA